MEKEKIEKLNKVLGNFSNVEFKTDGLGALEFEKEIFMKNFEVEKVKFRIERVAMQVAEKLGDGKEEVKAVEKVLGAFIASPSEARSANFFELDYTAMSQIIELIGEFQATPFLFTKRARETANIITK